MNTPSPYWGRRTVVQILGPTVLVGALLLLLSSGPTSAAGSPQTANAITLGNPHWNITLTDAGYSDFLLDNTPGFEGREYLSGEWGAAVGYQVTGGQLIPPQWLQYQFLYPDWITASPFGVRTPIAIEPLPNAQNLPVATSALENDHLIINLRHEMVDTVVGTPMGITAASAPGTPASIPSSRYALKQTITITTQPGVSVSGLQLFQFLHGLQSQRGVYANSLHSGPLSEFQYDVTLSGVDAWASGPGSSPGGLEDYIGFHAKAAPTALEIGHYGIEGNGVDDHWSGKPSTGTHKSVENNSLTGVDSLSPAQRWLAGAQRWDLGSLTSGQSITFEVVLTVRTGTRVSTGTNQTGGCNGGSSVPGGVDYEFEDVSNEGSCFGEYSQADDAEIAVRIAQNEFGPLTFPIPSDPAQIWKVAFSGTFSGTAHLRVGYDPTILPAGFDEEALCLYEFTGSVWQKLDLDLPAGGIDPVGHTIAVIATSLGPLALGVDGNITPSHTVTVSAASGGSATGSGNYPQGSSVTAVATPEPGFVFARWTEGVLEVATSPSYTFQVTGPRSLQANFVSAGSAKTISTTWQPSNGGTTSGDGAYNVGDSATVVATPSPGYKFSKWTENGVSVSTSASYTFTVTDHRALVAKFKPVYLVTATAEPLGAWVGDSWEYFQVEPDSPNGYESGEMAIMLVESLPGYSFVNWTQNGMEVSTDPNFQFNVAGNRDLVGHFAAGHRVDASPIPPHAGTILGTGVHEGTFTLEAEPKPGYVFLNWASADQPNEPLWTDPLYEYTPNASILLVANFGLAPATGNVAPSGGADNIVRLDNTRVAKVLKTALLQNDADADGDPLTLVSVGDATPAGATVALVGGFVVYTATAEDAGDGGFTYVLSDGPGGHLVTVTVVVTQTPANPVDTGANAVSILPAGADFVITFIGVPGHTYRVQYTATLSPPAWIDFTPVASFTAPANGVFTHTDTPPPNNSRFYRAIPMP